MKTKIITDSISDISKEIGESHNIEVIPVKVSLGGPYISTDEVEVIESVEWIEQNKKTAKFKGISTATYIEVFGKYVNQGLGIVCITAGSKSISNYDCACLASTQYPNANIQIIDAQRTGHGLGLIVLKAAKMAQKDESANAIAIRVERIISKVGQFGLLNSVNFLEYTGYCPTRLTVGSTLLNAKYEFSLKENMGFNTQRVGTNMDKAIETLCLKLFKDLKAIDPEVIILTYTISKEMYFSKLYKYVAGLSYFGEIVVCEADHYSTNFSGRSGLNVAYLFN